MSQFFVKIIEGTELIDECNLPAVPQKGSLIHIPSENKAYLIDRVDFVLDRKIKNGMSFFDHIQVKIINLSK